jgi:hypothetical protein
LIQVLVLVDDRRGVSFTHLIILVKTFYEILGWKEERKLKKEASRKEDEEENYILVSLTQIFGFREIWVNLWV